jgi:hypothetical protein
MHSLSRQGGQSGLRVRPQGLDRVGESAGVIHATVAGKSRTLSSSAQCANWARRTSAAFVI